MLSTINTECMEVLWCGYDVGMFVQPTLDYKMLGINL